MTTLEQAKEAKKVALKMFQLPIANAVGIGWDENGDYAVLVSLDKGQQGHPFPEIIKGVKVIYKVIGEVTLQGKK